MCLLVTMLAFIIGVETILSSVEGPSAIDMLGKRTESGPSRSSNQSQKL